MLRSKMVSNFNTGVGLGNTLICSIERFVSEFHSEGITDVREMCQRFTQDIPGFTNQLYSKTVRILLELLKTYINVARVRSIKNLH